MRNRIPTLPVLTLLLVTTALAGPSPLGRLHQTQRAKWKRCTMGPVYDSMNCRFLGAWPYGPALSVCVDLDRDLAFCSSGGGVLCVDITDCSNPRVLSDAIRTRGLVSEMSYSDSTVYVAAGLGGLEIWDVSDPAAPGFLGRFPTLDQTWDVEVRDTIAYVADWQGGLRLLSVADPTNPYLIGWYDSPGAAYNLAFYQDTLAFLTDWEEGTQVVSVADPTNPHAIANIPYGVANGGLDVEGDLAYVTDLLTGLFIYDISTPVNPVFVGGFETDPTDNLSVVDTLAFLPIGFGGTLVLDCADPASPVPLDTLSSQGSSDEVVVFDTFAIVADWEAGVAFASVADPTGVREIARLPTPDAAVWADKSGDYCYVADGKSGLRVIEVTEPAMPHEVGHLDLPGDVATVYARGAYVYVANWLEGVRIVDVHDPAHPRLVNSLPTRQRCNDIQIVDTLAYVTDDDSGLSIYSVADTANPYYVGGITTGRGVINLDIDGNYAYLVDGDLFVVDVSNPASPFVAGYFPTFDDAWDVVVSWPYALVAYEGGAADPLRVINVSDPYHPTLTGYTLLPDDPWGVAVDGGYCYVSCLDSGIRIFDISDPGTPTEVGYHLTPGWALGPDVEGALIYLASDYTGLGIYENELLTGIDAAPPGVTYEPRTPTICRGTLTLGGSQPADLLDVTGRRIQGLKPGKNDVRNVVPGVYFLTPCRGSGGRDHRTVVNAAEHHETQATRKVVIQR